MGMFDYYVPHPVPVCPSCQSAPEGDWQGKHGPCGLYTWEQGYTYPVSGANAYGDPVLPRVFALYSNCNCTEIAFGKEYTKSMEALGITDEKGEWVDTIAIRSIMVEEVKVAYAFDYEDLCIKEVRGYETTKHGFISRTFEDEIQSIIAQGNSTYLERRLADRIIHADSAGFLASYVSPKKWFYSELAAIDFAIRELETLEAKAEADLKNIRAMLDKDVIVKRLL